jgi:phosphatidylglycerophosphate synthase
MSDSTTVTAAAPDPAVVLLRATRGEATGAELKVGGLPVFERALRQLARKPGLRVIVAADGSIPVLAVLPPQIEVHRLGPDIGPALAALQDAWAGAIVTGADVVRRQSDALPDGIRVVDEATRRRAEDGIFAELLRGDLGFVARYVNKAISFRITRYLLCRLPVTPNQVTLGAAVIGLIGCFLIAAGTYPAFVGGFLLVQLQSVLDGCDGELARVRFQQSAIGEWLDTVVDDFMNLAIVASLGVGLARAGWGRLAWAAAGAAGAMFLFYNVVSYRELIRQGLGGELIKIHWKLARGRDVKSMFSSGGGGATRLLFSLGRRDTFVFGWLLFAVVKLLPLALVWALIVSLTCFGAAVGQLVARDPAPRAPSS